MQAVEEFKARARHGDPSESHDAAATITGDKMTNAMGAVLTALWRATPHITDEELCELYGSLSHENHERFPMQTPQSVRSRRAQLVRLGYVEATGKRQNANGNRCSTWDLTSAGVQYLADHEMFA